jgi:DNA-binding NarL/FixJ family response regulator
MQGRISLRTNDTVGMIQTTVVIIARAGQLWSSLQSLLRTVPAVDALYQFHDVAMLLERHPTFTPALLLLDFTTPNTELLKALPQLQKLWPQTHTLAFVTDEAQGRLAEAAGIQLVLPEGVLAATLWETIQALLLEEEPGYGNSPDENKS